MGAEGDRVAQRFERGSRAFAVMEAGKVVSYGWLSTEPEWIGELGLEISPADGEGYVWNCLTLPDHRRHGHYRALLEGVVAWARGEGLQRLWIGSIEDPAEKADADVGFAPVLFFESTTVFGWRILRARAAPDADRELVRAARARIRPWRVVDRSRHLVH
ncbi:MAG TPA: GNAT family N-acetyltransferase [Candidatus Dormibacteraeota bacterium]|nr:GNAT family N-acetyltransferase [Candidatus Dormibacteraeota bacterium]